MARLRMVSLVACAGWVLAAQVWYYGQFAEVLRGAVSTLFQVR